MGTAQRVDRDELEYRRSATLRRSGGRIHRREAAIQFIG